MSDHIVPKKVYYNIFAALLIGTALTVVMAFVDLHSFNIVVALLIAGVKASLVIFYFMHIKFSDRLTKLFVAIGFIWFFIMVGITMTDYLSRDWFVYHP